MVASDSNSSGRTIAGRYQLGQRRGTGVDAAVFDAFDAQLQRLVAIKLVHPELSGNESFQRRFRTAMDAASALHHPNVATVLDWGAEQWNDREVCYVVSEHLAGGSLREMLDRGRKLSPSQALVVGLDVCKALDAVHRAGMVHDDIRPSTIVFGDDRRLRIVDVGLASLLSEVMWQEPGDVGNERATYTSPERAQGHEVSGKSDVYALALTLLEAVSGSVPFVGDSPVATLANRVGRLMPVSADLGPLAAVLERAGRPEAEDRYSAAELGRALVQVAEKLPRPAPIPILAAGLFAERPLPPRPGATVDPTGPLERSPAPAAPAPPVMDPAIAEAPVPPIEPIEPSPPPVADAGESPGGPDVAESSAGPDPAGVAAPPPDAPAPPAAPSPPASVPPPPPPAVPVPAPPVPARPAPPPEPLLLLVDADRTADDTGGADTVWADDAASADDTAAEPTVASAPAPSAPLIDLGATAVVPAVGAPAHIGDTQAIPAVPPSPAGRRRGRRIAWIVAIVALLGAVGGTVAWFALRTITHVVPDLSTMTEGEARNEVSGSNWELTVVEEHSDDIEAGSVTRTEPVAGSTLAEEKELILFVSTGPTPRPLPDLTGMTIEEATTQLAAQDLVIEQADPVFDETAALGTVISWQVPDAPSLVAGDTVMPGTVVRVVPSAGPAPRPAPDLTSQTVVDATATLDAVGLVLGRLPDEFSNDVPAGAIIRQDPPPGADVPRGGTVDVVVSMGPDLVAIPEFTATDFPTVQQQLADAGLAVGSLLGNTGSGHLYQMSVDGTKVTSGQRFLRGTPVDMIFL